MGVNLLQACTGSGKTLAFVIPIVEMILRLRASGNKLPNGVLALVILPIRYVVVVIVIIAIDLNQSSPRN